MSGSKRATVEISHEEYERLRNAENSLRLANEASKRSEAQLHAQSVAAIKAGMDWMKTRQQEFESLSGSFYGQLADFESRALDRIDGQQQFLLERISESEANANQGIYACLEEYRRTSTAEIDQLRQESQAQALRMASQLNHQLQNDREKDEIAREWCESAARLAQFIRTSYQPEFFFPGELGRLEAQVAQARDNLALNMPEAVFMSSQSLYFTLSEFRRQLEQLENEWRILFYSAWEEVLKVHAWFLENETVEAVDLDGEAMNLSLDVDFWSDRRWSKALQSIEGLIRQFEDSESVFDITALRSIMETEVPSMQAALVDMVRDARIAALNSQLRANIADLVIEALCEQGFTLHEANYAHDMRRTFGARLVSYDGGEVIVNVSPSGKQIGENQLEVHSHDEAARSEHELHQRWHEINRSLAGKGLEVTNPQVLRPGGAANKPEGHSRKQKQVRQPSALAGMDG